METRIGIKIIALVLQDRLSSAKYRLLELTTSISNKCRREATCENCINLFLNNIIFDNNININ